MWQAQEADAIALAARGAFEEAIATSTAAIAACAAELGEEAIAYAHCVLTQAVAYAGRRSADVRDLTPARAAPAAAVRRREPAPVRCYHRAMPTHAADHPDWIAMAPLVAAAFDDLARAGLAARMNFTDTLSDGVAEIAQPGARGYVFWHAQDDAHARATGVLRLAFGVFAAPPTDDAIVAIGHEIRAALAARGLHVDWNGQASTRIDVHRQPLPEAAPPVAAPPAAAPPPSRAAFVIGNQFSQILLGGSPVDLDLSDDGAYVAVAIWRGQPCIRVFATADGACVGEYGHGAWTGVGVAFVEDGRSLCYLTWDDGHHATLWKVALPGGEPARLVALDGEDRCKRLTRDAGGTRVAIGGAAVRVVDVATARMPLRVPCDVPGADGVAHFADADHVWVFGSEPGQLVLHAAPPAGPPVAAKRLAAPAATGLHVATSPDGRWLLAVGAGGRGVALYDLTTDRRIPADADDDLDPLDDDLDVGGAIAFAPDSRCAILPTRYFFALGLPDLAVTASDTRRVDEPGDHAACVSTARAAPLVAFGFDRSQKLVLVPTAPRG